VITNSKQKTLYLQAPAKINLILRVLSKRDDGYHELETWMQKISLCDTITAEILDLPGITLTCHSSDVPVDETNLVWRAADTFFKRSKNAKNKGISIDLQKNIPVSAGLGGGSSDAGTLLKGLNDYFAKEFSTAELIDMGKTLGADVPFFVVQERSVLATGIGEKMLPVDPLAKSTLILVNPGIRVSTASIFEKFALTRVDKNSTLTGFRKIHPEDLTLSALENDLEKVTIELFPVIEEVKVKLKSAGADAVLMSGSGPTVFGVFAWSPTHRNESIENTVADLRQKYGDKVYIAD
jgi:4-diphosphocytidyl-2-C-methyl-D-erythritol kinase